MEEDEDFNKGRDVSTDSEIEAFVEMPSDNYILMLKGLKGQSELQITNGVFFFMECYGKEKALFCGRFFAEKSEFLRGAVGLFDFCMKNALGVIWRYVNVFVYFDVG